MYKNNINHADMSIFQTTDSCIINLQNGDGHLTRSGYTIIFFGDITELSDLSEKPTEAVEVALTFSLLQIHGW